MRVLILADIDDIHWQHGSGEVDLILALGDISDCVILEAWEAFGAPPVFAVKGNHDAPTPFLEGISDLNLKCVEFGGLKFAGFGGAWRFRPRGNCLYTPAEAADLLITLPAADVLICHNSPRGILDKPYDIHLGFDALNWYIEKHNPKLLFHGHQHVNCETIVGITKIIGVHGERLIEITP